MKRDPKRIDIIIEMLRVVWKQNPDLRLGQLFVNIDTRSDSPDLFMLEDDRFLQVLEQLAEEHEVNKRKLEKKPE